MLQKHLVLKMMLVTQWHRRQSDKGIIFDVESKKIVDFGDTNDGDICWR